MAAVLTLSLMPPGPQLPSTGWDKANHALGFALLGWLGLQAFTTRPVAVLLGLLAYGGLIELLQSLSAYRMAEWADLWADALGLLIGALAYFVGAWSWRQWRLRRAEDAAVQGRRRGRSP